MFFRMMHTMDGDGKAEIVMKTSDGTIDGKGKVSFQVGAYAFDTLGISLSNGFTMSYHNSFRLLIQWFRK